MTMLFGIIVSALTLSVVGWVVRPLFFTRQAPAGERQDWKIAVYRQQLAELEQERTTRSLTEKQFELASRELERRLLEEDDQAQADRPSGRPLPGKAAALLLLFIIPAITALLYWKLGNQAALSQAEVPAVSAVGSPHSDAGGLDALAAQLKRRLDAQPDDGAGWALLARTYAEVGRHAEAAVVYEKAMGLLPDDAQLLADYADVLGMLHGRKLEGQPEALIQRALNLEPNNVKALMLAGTVAFDRKQYARAATYWERAKAHLPADTGGEVAQELTGGIEEARGLAGGGGAKEAAPTAADKPSQSPLVISGTVRLGSRLTGKASSTDTLFVFAKAVGGPPMPVAIVRAAAKDLPFSFRLDDSTSPMPTRKLSDVGPVIIVARVSKTGEAMPKSGDLEGMSGPIQAGANGVTVTIDREIR